MYTKRPNFNNFGRFFYVQKQENPCTPKTKEARFIAGLQQFPVRCKGLSQQCGAKVQNLFQILAHGCKQLAQPCQYWLSVPHEQDKNGND